MPKGTAIQVHDPFSGGEVFGLRINVKRDAEGKIISGLSIGPTTEQNQAFILILAPGECKEYPTLGVNIEQLLLDDDLLGLRHSIRRNFSMDGLTTTKLELYDIGRIKIESKY